MKITHKILISTTALFFILVIGGTYHYLTKVKTQDISLNLSSSDSIQQVEDTAYYYLATPINGDYTNQKFSFYEIDKNLKTSASLVANLEGHYDISLKIKNDKILMVHNQKELQTLNLKNGEVKTIANFDLNTDQISNNKWFNEGKQVVYTSQTSTSTELRSKDIDSGHDTLLYTINEYNDSLSPSYSIDSVSEDSSQIFLRKSSKSSDDFFVLDLPKRLLSKIDYEGEKSHGDYLATGYFENPSGTLSAYLMRNYYAYKTDNFQGSHFSGIKCLKDLSIYPDKGDAIILKDLKTLEEKEIYRNLSASDNLCRNLLRRIGYMYWLDDNTIAFYTPIGVYSLDIKTLKTSTLYVYPSVPTADHPQPELSYFLNYVDKNMLGFADGTIVNYENNITKNVLIQDPDLSPEELRLGHGASIEFLLK